MKPINSKVAISEPDVARRGFVNNMCKAALGVSLPANLYADSLSETPLHVQISSAAKQLAAGEVRLLKMLIPTGCEANLTPVIERFKSQTGISVEMIPTAVDQINTHLLLDTMSDSGEYDLALPATFGLPDLVSSGALLPLGEFAAKYEPANFREQILYNIGDSFDNEVYGFQADGDAYLMFYLQDLLESPIEQARYADIYGLSLKVPLTWQELDRQIQYFHRPDQDLSGGLLFRTPGYLAWEWWVRFHAKGYWPLSPTLEPQINSDAGVEALEEMVRVSQFLAPESRTLGLFQNWERYSRGNVYCNIGWGGTQKYLNKAESKVKSKMLFGHTPGGYVDGELLLTPYFNWGWNYVVTQRTRYPELAYLFSLFASTAHMSTVAVREAGGYFDPYRAEHYDDKGIREAYSEQFLAVHETSLLNSIPDLYLKDQSQYFRSLSDGLASVLDGKVGAKKALDRVAQQWKIITSRNDVALQTERWNNLKSKYPASVQALLKDL